MVISQHCPTVLHVKRLLYIMPADRCHSKTYGRNNPGYEERSRNHHPNHRQLDTDFHVGRPRFYPGPTPLSAKSPPPRGQNTSVGRVFNLRAHIGDVFYHGLELSPTHNYRHEIDDDLTLERFDTHGLASVA